MKRPSHLDLARVRACSRHAGDHEPLMTDGGAHVEFRSNEFDDEDGKPMFFIVTTVCRHCGQFYTRTEDVT